MPGVCPPPAAVRVSEINLDPMHGLSLVLLFGLEDELLEDGVIAGDDADGEQLAVASVVLASPSYAQPVAPVVNGMCCIRRGLEHHSCLDLSWDVLVFFVVIAKGVVCYPSTKSGIGRASGRLEFARTLPFWTTREPEHEPVIGVIFLREVGCQEESYGAKICQSRRSGGQVYPHIQLMKCDLDPRGSKDERR